MNVADVLTTAFTSVVGTINTALAAVVPVALGVVGTVIAVKFGIRFFKSIVK